MRARQSASAHADSTELAGWVYADLFLALMVVFLATISFVPIITNIPGAAQKSSLTKADAGTNLNKGLSIVYSSFDPKQIAIDIAAFKVENGIPASAQIIYAQILGGFNSKVEKSDAGRMRALQFGYLLEKNVSDLFGIAATTVGPSTAIGPNQVALRITFTTPKN